MSLYVLVQPVEHVCPGLQDVGFVRRVDVFSLTMDKPVSLIWKGLHMVIHRALLFQLRFKNNHLSKRMQSTGYCVFKEKFISSKVEQLSHGTSDLVLWDNFIFLRKNEQRRALQLVPVLAFTDDT